MVAGFLCGCSQKLNQEAMTPYWVKTVNKHPQTVTVAVSGGQSASADGPVKISNDQITAAIVDTINSSGVFSKVIPVSGGDYILSVALVDMDRPMFGASMTVKLSADWTLRKADSNQIVWQQNIRSENTVPFDAAFAGSTRGKMATAGAVNDNVKQGLELISSLSL